MKQIDRPRGLIDYATLADADRVKQGQLPLPVLKTLLRPRTLLYFGIWASIGLAMFFALGVRSRIDISAIQDRNPLYVQLSNGDVRNNYTVKLRNMQNRPRTMRVSVEGLPGAVIWTDESGRDEAGPSFTTMVDADKVGKLRVFVSAPGDGPQRSVFAFTLSAADAPDEVDTDEVSFDRPIQMEVQS